VDGIARVIATALSELPTLESGTHIHAGELPYSCSCQLFRLNEILIPAMSSESPDPLKVNRYRGKRKMAPSPPSHHGTLVIINRP
jgi:hypothetical protein